MPKNKEIKSILIIGSGPIVIGQACEFDYSGSQAAKALKKEGFRVILVNSNPATIMTDPEMAHATYIEPLTHDYLKKIIEIEKPDAVLPTLGGQTALNLSIELEKSGVLKENNVELLGASANAIEIAENRWKFKEAMDGVGIKTLKATYAKSFDEGINASKEIGFPLMLRPSFILGGGGTSVVNNEEDFKSKLSDAFNASPTQEVLIEESIYGWKEFELEVMRDSDGNGVIVCGIENFDPMGVHTGDSITVAPIQTLSDKEYQTMRDEALLCLDTIGIATGGSNVQFAINPENGDRRIIEMNPRVSRSSALASKATGFPIAKFAALLAVGYNLTELENDITGTTPASFEPVQDYVVVKIPRFDFPKFPSTDDILGTSMQSVGEDKEYQTMRDEALLCLDTIGIATGGSNVQFAINPENGDRRIIEMNPRVSRSSALASKATGFPIAKFAALLAVGYNLTELENDITGTTPASFEPVQDYVVVKIPRFDFPKFPSTDDILGTSMQSVGEVMSIASTFTESLTKAIRSLEIGKSGIRNIDNRFIGMPKEILQDEIRTPRPRRIFAILEAIRRNWPLEDIAKISSVDIWFLQEIEKSFNVNPENTPSSVLKMLGWTEEDLDNKESKNELESNRVYKLVDTCSAEFESKTPYLYSTNGVSNDDTTTNKKKVVVIGSGPNRIGQGIEFDYCCVHGISSLKENGFEAIMINSNPETVSTDYDTADKLYFEPLTWREVKSVLNREQPDSVIIQLGGQTPLKLAKNISKEGFNIAGSSLDVIDKTEDRDLFQKLCLDQNIRQPESKIAKNENELVEAVKEIGFPVLLRPSYVLGGRAMRVVQTDEELENYLDILASADEDGNPFKSGPLLVDQFLTETIEIDVDLISDGKEVYIAGILEHLEPAGVHSGDSTAVIPPYSVSEEMLKEIEEKSKKLALGLNVKGLLNIQFAIKDEELFILEANPRASRTMPFVAKVTGNQIIKAGTLLMLGYSIDEVRNKTKYLSSSSNKVAIKKAIFPWSRFPAEDTMLGPEMKATGEVLGVGKEFGTALNKAYAAAGVEINNKEKGIFVTLSDSEKPNFIKTVNKYLELGFTLYSTEGTGKFLKTNGIDSVIVGKADDLGQTSLTIIEDKLVSLVINTPTYANELSDGWKIRRLSHETGVAVVSSVREADAFIEAFLNQNLVLDDLEVIQDVS